MHLWQQSLHQLHTRLAQREVTSEEITRSVLERVGAVENDVKAYVTRLDEAALAQAKAVDAKIAQGGAISPLAGIPSAIKDNMCTKGVVRPARRAGWSALSLLMMRRS